MSHCLTTEIQLVWWSECPTATELGVKGTNLNLLVTKKNTLSHKKPFWPVNNILDFLKSSYLVLSWKSDKKRYYAGPAPRHISRKKILDHGAVFNFWD